LGIQDWDHHHAGLDEGAQGEDVAQFPSQRGRPRAGDHQLGDAVGDEVVVGPQQGGADHRCGCRNPVHLGRCSTDEGDAGSEPEA
jgi:hypothetical protein